MKKIKSNRYKLIFRSRLSGEVIRLLENGELIIEDVPKDNKYDIPKYFDALYKRKIEQHTKWKVIGIMGRLIQNAPVEKKVSHINNFELVFSN